MDAKEAIEYAKKAKVLHIERYGDGKKISFYSTIIEALEKQVPKKPKHIANDGFRYCPNCGECAETMGYDAIQFNFCDKCGQRLNWDK